MLDRDEYKALVQMIGLRESAMLRLLSATTAEDKMAQVKYYQQAVEDLDNYLKRLIVS
jgi:hypothetical protein